LDVSPVVAELAALIRAEQVRAQYRNVPTAIIAHAIVSAALWLGLHGSVATYKVSGWLAVLYACFIGRFLLYRAFNRARPSAADMPRWNRYGFIAAAVGGVTWGVGGILLYVPNDPPAQFFLIIGLAGMASGSVYSAASVLPAFFAHLYPSLLLPSLPFFAAGDSLHLLVGCLLVLYVGFASRVTFSVNRSIVDTIKLRFENVGLIAELREQKATAEEANIAKSRFLAAASHDLRQPVHALGFFVEALHVYPLPADGREVVRNIRRSVDAMEGLFNALLDISRLDAGIVQPCVATVPLAPVLERVRFEYEPFALQKGLALTAVDTSVFVRSDPALLERIVRNLVSNALCYADRGGVVFGCRRNGDGVRVEVWDSGRGIPADKHREIFQEFLQLENPERDRGKGLGLGLAIVARLTRLLNHPIELRSVVGKGSVFAITVPRGRPEDYNAGQSPAEVALDLDVANALILVIDDEVAVREGMQTLLRKWRCEVVVAASGAEILEKIVDLERLPDLIVADYRLRDAESGIQVAKRLCEEFNSDIPVLIITGDTGPERLREAEGSGMYILHKPLNPARLRALISSLRGARTPGLRHADAGRSPGTGPG
jgi:two-component system, sensor histidine kinase